ncbi:MAG: four-carbon acid sugar kinase family protein [Cyanobium sp.]
MESPPSGRPGLKIVVLDDDPTGSQTVHSAPLLLRWDADSLRRGLADPSPFLFLLANTRALDPEAATARVQQIALALRPALLEAQRAGWIRRWLLVSRGDSTLRGHFPLELDTLAAVLGEDPSPLPSEQSTDGETIGHEDAIPEAAGQGSPVGDRGGGFDGCLLVPAFLPGGRTTVDGVHRLQGVPVHTTAFARDGRFAYHTSHLSHWIEAKSGGRIAAHSVERLSLAELDAAVRDLAQAAGSRDDLAQLSLAELDVAAAACSAPAAAGGFAQLCRRLACLRQQRWLTVDAEREEQLTALGAAVRRLSDPAASGPWGRPRRFLFQSAASLLNGLAPIGPQPLAPAALAALRRSGPQGPRPGLVLVGSHVPLADQQLETLLADRRCCGVELAVPTLLRALEGPLPDRLLPSLEAAWLEALRAVLAQGRTPVLYTSRGEVHCARPQDRIRLGLTLAATTARLAAALAPELGYLISKGGITTHTLLAEGLKLASVQLQGQLLPGLSLVLAQAPAAAAPLPLLTFPGNLGDATTLWQAWRLLEGDSSPAG